MPPQPTDLLETWRTGEAPNRGREDWKAGKASALSGIGAPFRALTVRFHAAGSLEMSRQHCQRARLSRQLLEQFGGFLGISGLDAAPTPEGLTADERDAYEERAAILEYDGGWP